MELVGILDAGLSPAKPTIRIQTHTNNQLTRSTIPIYIHPHLPPAPTTQPLTGYNTGPTSSLKMLPDVLHDTYQRYKSDTDRFVKWLVETATMQYSISGLETFRQSWSGVYPVWSPGTGEYQVRKYVETWTKFGFLPQKTQIWKETSHTVAIRCLIAFYAIPEACC